MLIIPLDSSALTLSAAGGKGANLGRLVRAGYAVPPGFIISTGAYRAYVASNGLASALCSALDDVVESDAASLDQASLAIRAAFSGGRLSEDLLAALREAYEDLLSALELAEGTLHSADTTRLAVRSSATTEDLPELSFAGLHDSYLNIVGWEVLLRAVVDCWSSLWTARAIGYRLRNGIPHEGAALAVVVQAMVPSDVSGVLFTANPLTGRLNESVVDASYGLGEALVSGRVEPDHFVVDSASGHVRDRRLGAKSTVARPGSDGTVELISEQNAGRQTLSEEQLAELVSVGASIQAEFGLPQDIEWAIADGTLYILQSRAVTSLYPVPQVSPDPLIVWFSFGAVQGVLGPLTPLGQQTIQHLVAGGASAFGVRLDPERMGLFQGAGERLWVRISDMLHHPIGNRMLGGVLRYVDPSVGRILASLAEEPAIGAGRGTFRFSTLRHVVRFALGVLVRMPGSALYPERAHHAFHEALEEYLASARSTAAVRMAATSDRYGRLASVVSYMRGEMARPLGYLLPRFVAAFGPSMAALNTLNRYAGESRELSLRVTRSLPGNVTSEMDLALWSTAESIRKDAQSLQALDAMPPDVLAGQYLERTLPAMAQAAIEGFMERYGMRGVSEIDIGRPRWRDEPAAVVSALKGYLQIDPALSPDGQYLHGAQVAHEAVEELADVARRQSLGWLKAKLVRAAARRVRALTGLRESPKFAMVRLLWVRAGGAAAGRS